jgi:rubredoxin
MSETNDTLVRREWACPLCGERRMDFLACHDEAKDITENESDVECLMCGTHYRLRLGRSPSEEHYEDS